MNANLQKIFKIIITITITLTVIVIAKKNFETVDKIEKINLSSKSLALKNFLIKNNKPARIEIFGLSNRFSAEINEIKKLKIAQDKNSDFYITIQLFSDENDAKAPLIAQIRFIDIQSGNLIKEESINLE